MLLQGNQGQAGKQVGQNLTAGLGEFSELLITELMARYYEQTYRGNKFAAQVAAANPTGVSTGILGAAGTPLLLVWNPAGSGKNLVILQSFIAMRNNGTVSPGSFVWSAGPTTPVTANLSQPLNLASLQASGSVAKFVANAAATGLSALLYVRPIMGVGAATTATTTGFPQGYEETAGGLIVPPGYAAAIISTVTGTAAVVDAGIVWDEIPV
jgi:hypothetical protein